MFNRLTALLIVIISISSCNLEGVKKKTDPNFFEIIDTSIVQPIDIESKTVLPKKIEKDTLDNGSINDLVWNGANGLRIEWEVKQTSNKVLKGNVVLVNYKARVARGEVYDSNTELNKPIPLKTGIGQLIPGWETGLLQMSAGDKGRIMIPSKLAYGEAGIIGRVPQNADIIVDIEIVAIIEPIELLDGVKLYKYESVTEQTYPTKDQLITFHYFAYRTGDKPKMYTNSYEKGEPFKVRFENDNIVEGLHIGLSQVSANEKAFIEIPSKVAYGKKGLLDLVPSNTDIVFDVRVESIK
jgi:FKBP-type peptidyl-prolyl cis-trans isomerase